MPRPTALVALCSLLALATPATVHAQSISFGITGGASLSTFTGDVEDDIANYATYIVGAFARVEAMGFAVQPGLYYTAKGAKFDDSEAAGHTAINYIQVPLVLRLGMGSGRTQLYIGAGPAIGFKVSCKFVAASEGTDPTDCDELADTDPVESTEVSGILEAGIAFGKFSLGARADLGLSNLVEAADAGSPDAVDVKTRTVSAVFSILF